MAKKKRGQSKLELILNWEKRPQLDKLIDEGWSTNKITKWMNEQGFKITNPTVDKYIKKRKEAIARGYVLTELNVDGRRKHAKRQRGIDAAEVVDKIIEMTQQAEFGADNEGTDEIYEDNNPIIQKELDEVDKQTKFDPISKSHLKVIKNHNNTVNDRTRVLTPEEREENEIKKLKRKLKQQQSDQPYYRIKSDIELLDEIIQKGYHTLKNLEFVSPDIAIKALKLKNELTEGAHLGLTTYGIEEIRLREAAKAAAIQCILLEYIPEEKHAEVIARMEAEERKFYEELGLGTEYELLKQMEAEEETEIEENEANAIGQ